MVVRSKRYMENNPLATLNTAIIVTSHQGHLTFLKYALQGYMKTGKYVICSYDRHGETIPSDIFNIPHSWAFKHTTYGAEKRNGWLWDIVYGAAPIALFDNFYYIVTTNSDCVWEKPENIDLLIGMMGDNHLMSASSEDSLIHTCNVVWKRDCFLDFVDWVKVHLKDNIPESYSPEVLLRDFVSKTGYRNLRVDKQPKFPKEHFYGGKTDHYSSYSQDSTFKDFVGYRNLGAEHKAACLEHLEPIEKKFFDLRNNGEFMNKHEQDTLYHFYMTEDRRWLYKYWSEGEDSYWNRRYYPLEYYGEEVLSDDSKRKELGPPSERIGHFDRWKYNSYILKDNEYHSKWKKVIEGG